MKGIYHKLRLALLCGAIILSTTANANEKRDGAEIAGLLNGRVPTTKAEKIEQKMHRIEEDKTVFEKGRVDEESREDLAVRMTQEFTVAQSSEGDEQQKAGFRTDEQATVTYRTSHEGAIHSLNSLSLFGEYVTLNDGLTWYVRPSDRYKTGNFTLVAEYDYFLNTYLYYYTDTILILPCTNLFSSYDYVLVNCTTGERMEVDLVEPLPGQLISTYYIAAIINDKLILNDNSVWEINLWDQYMLNRWALGDSVTIGINDALFSGSSTNILINVQLNEHTRGYCIN